MGTRSTQRAAGTNTGRGATLERGQTPRLDVIDSKSPNLARMNNYLLGGKDHYGADREACERLTQIVPEAPRVAQAAHRFLLRATSHLARDHQVRQYVVFGAGLPTSVGVHHVARRIQAGARTVYADHDPLALVHGRALWEDRYTLVMRAAPAESLALLKSAAVRQMIDFSSPVAVLLVSGLHSVPEDAGPSTVLQQAARILASGSFIAASHLVSEDAEVRRKAGALLREAAAGRWGRVRPRADVDAFFGGLQQLTPGLVDVHQWRPGGDRAAGGGSLRWAERGAVAVVH
ncbi:SAM-dependent methyltransferase [Streptomyces sp. NPDC018026]|uniref:SAM-dependent methyltransferase n=1 Tax=Streptomyces sp. NPDC018026 TaxID=3365031 RepID=UPI0037ACD5D9